MGKPKINTEPYHQYIQVNYQDKSLSAMADELKIDVRIVKRALKVLGIVRPPELIGKFRGHKNQNKEWDNYFRENYLIQPLTHMCRHLGFSVKVGERMMKRLGLVRSPELLLKFKNRNLSYTSTHTVSKKAKPRKKKVKPVLKLKRDQSPKVETVLPNKTVDYSQMRMVKIDHKTWVYRDKTA